MSQILAIDRNGKLMIGVGLTLAELAKLDASGKSLVFDLDKMEALADGAKPTGLVLVAGTDDEDLIAQFSPFLPPRRRGEGESRNG